MFRLFGSAKGNVNYCPDCGAEVCSRCGYSPSFVGYEDDYTYETYEEDKHKHKGRRR
jgi:hypothetical protein